MRGHTNVKFLRDVGVCGWVRLEYGKIPQTVRMVALRDDIWSQDLPSKKQEFDTVTYGAGLLPFVITVILMRVAQVHRHNLANTILEGKTLFLRRIEIRKREKIGSNRPLIYIHPFPPLLSQFSFICPSSTQ